VLGYVFDGDAEQQFDQQSGRAMDVNNVTHATVRILSRQCSSSRRHHTRVDARRQGLEGVSDPVGLGTFRNSGEAAGNG